MKSVLFVCVALLGTQTFASDYICRGSWRVSEPTGLPGYGEETPGGDTIYDFTLSLSGVGTDQVRANLAMEVQHHSPNGGVQSSSYALPSLVSGVNARLRRSAASGERLATLYSDTSWAVSGIYEDQEFRNDGAVFEVNVRVHAFDPNLPADLSDLTRLSCVSFSSPN